MKKQKKKIILLPLVKYKDKLARLMYKHKDVFVYNVLYGMKWKRKQSLEQLT
jgi:hypothetical protein